jgi:hypothetical protein
MKNLSKLLVVCALSIMFSLGVAAQSENFSDPNVEYSFDVPDPTWKLITKPSATSPNVEYVYRDRRDGLLEIRKLQMPKNAIMSDVIREEEQKLQFRPGYVAGAEEVFSGNLKGTAFNFEYIAAGRNMSGRYYFLRSGDTIYVIRFTGERDKLKSIRNQTDSIARTFTVKKG